MARTSITPIQKRFSDIDPFRHVNNIAQQAYFDLGKADYYREVLGAEALTGRIRIMIVSTASSYLGQTRIEDEVRVTTTCEKIGNKSVHLFQQTLCGDEVRSESRAVMVAFDFESQQTVPVPEEWRRRMLAD